MKYKFEQFNIEIENPTIEIDMTKILDNTITKKLAIPIVLITNNTRFGILLEEINYINSWDDEDIPALVDVRLIDFEVIS